MYIDRHKIDFDKKLINITFECFSDKVHDLVINLTIEHYVPLDNMVIYAKLNIPEDSDDRFFRKEVLKTVVNVGKLMNGVYGNPIIQAVFVRLIASRNSKPTFPITVVRILPKNKLLV